MGNSLRRSIQSERWDDVRVMLESDEAARERARSKTYRVKDRHSSVDSPSSKLELTALHLACHHGAPEDIIRTLLGIRSEGASIASYPGGEVPLHFTVRSGTSIKSRFKLGSSSSNEGVVDLLLEADPQSASKVSSAERGAQTPLHLACAVQASPTVIQKLVDSDPEAAKEIKDGKGKTAQEIAMSHTWLFSPVWRYKVGPILGSSLSLPSFTGSSTTAAAVQNGLSSSAAQNEVAPSAPPLPADGLASQIPIAAGGESEMCVVCWDGRADHVLIPCGHMCLCGQCAAMKPAMRGKCPVCKSKIQKAMKVFRAGVPDPSAGPEPAAESVGDWPPGQQLPPPTAPTSPNPTLPPLAPSTPLPPLVPDPLPVAPNTPLPPVAAPTIPPNAYATQLY